MLFVLICTLPVTNTQHVTHMLRFHHHTSTSFLFQLISSSTQLSCSCSSMFHELFIQFSPSHRNTAHSHVTHMSFLTLSLRPHQHPSLWSISLMSIFSTHLKFPHIIPHMIYHTSPTSTSIVSLPPPPRTHQYPQSLTCSQSQISTTLHLSSSIP